VQKKAWCSECGHYVLITSEGICPVGHPKPALRGVEEVPDDYVLPEPPARSAVPVDQSHPSPPVYTPDDYLGGFPGAGDIELADEILEAPIVLDESRLRRLIGIPVLAVLAAAAITVGGIAWLDFRYSPSYCLAQISIGVQERDWDRVDKYVDVDAVVASAMDSAAAGLTQNDPPSYIKLTSNVAKATSPYVAEKVEDALRKSVEHGPSSATEPAAGSLRDVLAVMSVKNVTYDEKGALATVGVRNASGAPVNLAIRMQRGFFTRHWRITAIENILDLSTRTSARSNLVPMGATARAGDWDVRVVRVARKGNDALYEPDNAAHMSRAEHRTKFADYGYLVVTLRAIYHGEERTGHFMRDLTPKLVTVRGTTSSSFPAQVPTRIERMDAPRGGTGIQGEVYFFERSKDMSGVCMAMQYRDPDDSPSTTFFALQ
jgi:hypothetical protein